MPPLAERDRIDRGRNLLVGSRCAGCNATSWPGRTGCHRCGKIAMEPEAFSASGALLTCTTVWVGRPGLEPPYTLGQVKLDGGPLVFAHVRCLSAETTMPVDVRLVVSDDPDAVPPFWFEPEEMQ